MGLLFDVAPVEASLAPLLAHVYPGVGCTPAIRIADLATRAGRTNALFELLKDFDATIDAVARLEGTIASLMLGLRQRRDMIKTAMAPVTGLPVETLREIFLIATASDTSLKAPITLSHVSSHWSAVITGTKELWTTIYYPGMLHECAERSKDLRLKFTPAPRAHWPDDLEITAAEASRFSTLLSRLSVDVGGQGLGSRPQSFTSSLARHARLLSVDRVEIAGPDHIVEDTFAAQAFNLTEGEQSALLSMCKSHLVDVAISHVSVTRCGDWLSALSKNAPMLSRLRFNTVFGDELSEDEDDMGVVQTAYLIDDPLCCPQLASLTIVGCSPSVYLGILNAWILPDLVSLTLDLRETPGHRGFHSSVNSQ